MGHARLAGAAAAVLLAMAGVAAWQAPRLLNWNHYRSTIESVASATLGRTVHINGAIELSLLPQATLTAADVDVPDAGDGASAAAAEIQLRVSLSGLLAGRIEPQDVVLHRPAVRLPWPLAALPLPGAPPGSPAGGLHARVEDGKLLIGELQVSGVQGELRVDSVTGGLSASGLATVLGRPWRATGRLGRTGADGTATIALSLDGQGSGIGTGIALSGQIDAQGGLAGRVSGRGPDLSLVLPAPAQAWRGDGRIVAVGGLVVADDLDMDIGGAPARGAVALRFRPQLRLDAALATSRLDLDAWLPPLLEGGRTALATGIDLSAEAASLRGGTVRRLRAGFELTAAGVVLRQVDAVLPGEAVTSLAGTLAEGHFTGSGSVTMPNVAQTLDWLRPMAPGLAPGLAGVWPPLGVHTAQFSADLTASGGSLAAAGLRGDVDGVPVRGDAAFKAGSRPVLAAHLTLAGPALDAFTPKLPGSLQAAAPWLSALAAGLSGFDAGLDVTADRPSWAGASLDTASLALRCQAGVLDVRSLSVSGRDGSLALSGRLGPGGRVTDGRVEASVRHLEALAGLWPADPGLLHGSGMLSATVSGVPEMLSVTATAEQGDGRAQVSGVLNLADPGWSGGVTLQHPGASRLLASLGLPDAGDWLGEGSLSLQAQAEARMDGVTLTGLGLSAGLLRMAGDAAVRIGGGRPAVSGTLDVDTLPLPQPPLRSADPLRLGWLQGVDGTLSVRVAHLLLGPVPDGLAAAGSLSLQHGLLRASNVNVQVGGGTFQGGFSLNASAPPEASVAGTLNGFVVDGPAFNTPVDLVAGRADLTVDVSAKGYSPAGMLAALTGRVEAVVRDGALSGVDGGQLLSVLTDAGGGKGAAVLAGASQALQGGATPFSRLNARLRLADGAVTLETAEIQAPSGRITLSGQADLPDDSLNLRLSVQPSLAGTTPPPIVSLRLIGPAEAARRTPELTGLLEFLDRG